MEQRKMDKIVLFLALLCINDISPQTGYKTIGAILQLNSFKQFYRLETKLTVIQECTIGI